MSELAGLAPGLSACVFTPIGARIDVLPVARVGLAIGSLVALVGVLAPVDVADSCIAAGHRDEKQAGPQASPEHPARLQRPDAAVISVK